MDDLENRLDKLGFRLDELSLTFCGMTSCLVDLARRMEKVEVAVDSLRTDVKNINGNLLAIRTRDFRLMFGALITVALGLSGMMAKGFGWL